MDENITQTESTVKKRVPRSELSHRGVPPILLGSNDSTTTWTTLKDMSDTMDADMLALLRALSTPLPQAFVHKMRGSDYASHAVITQRLLALIGPFDQEVIDVFYNDDNRVEGAIVRFTFNLNGRLVHITEAGSSDAELQNKKGDPVHNQGNLVKLCISDALKRAAMRIGVGLNLWSQFQGKPEYVLPGWLGISPWPVNKINNFLHNAAEVIEALEETDKEAPDLPSWLVDKSGKPTEDGAIFTKVIFDQMPHQLSAARVKALHRYTASRALPILEIEIRAVTDSISDTAYL